MIPPIGLAAATLLLLAPVAPAPAPDFVTPLFSARVTRNIAYGHAAARALPEGRKQLTLDLYEPSGSRTQRKRPAFVAIHGGGWSRGSSGNDNIADLCERLAERGFVCAAINYRLTGDDPVAPGRSALERARNAAIADAGTAAGWLVRNARRLGLDASRIAIGGSSAGAITSLYLAYRDRHPHIRAVVSWSGGLEGEERIVDGGGPPLLIIHGDADTSIPVAEARALAVRAREAGLRSTAILCAGLEHHAPLDRRPLGASLHDRLAYFLFESLNLAALGGPRPQPPPEIVGTESIPCPR